MPRKTRKVETTPATPVQTADAQTADTQTPEPVPTPEPKPRTAADVSADIASVTAQVQAAEEAITHASGDEKAKALDLRDTLARRLAALEDEFIRVQIDELEAKKRELVRQVEDKERAKRYALLQQAAGEVMALCREGETAVIEALKMGKLVWSPLMAAAKSSGVSTPRAETSGGGTGGAKLEKSDYKEIRQWAKDGMATKEIANRKGISIRYTRAIIIARKGAGGPLED